MRCSLYIKSHFFAVLTGLAGAPKGVQRPYYQRPLTTGDSLTTLTRFPSLMRCRLWPKGAWVPMAFAGLWPASHQRVRWGKAVCTGLVTSTTNKRFVEKKDQ